MKYLLNSLDMEQYLELLDCSLVADLPGVELLAQQVSELLQQVLV